MTLTYKQKVEEAISLADNWQTLDFIREKIETTDQINRHTKEGRDLTKDLLKLLDQRIDNLITKGLEPF